MKDFILCTNRISCILLPLLFLHKSQSQNSSRMGKKISALLLLLALVVAVPAQTLQLKVGGGFASQYSDKKVVGAFKFGVGYEYELSQHWAINPSFLFYGKGWKDQNQVVNIYDDNGEQVFDEDGNPVTGLMGRSVSANYLELPVLFNYYLRTGNAQYIVLGAGPYVSCGIGGKIKTKGDSERFGGERLYYDEKTFKKDGAHRFDTGIQAMAGYQFAMGVTLGVEADFGLLKYSSASGRNVSWLVSLVYSFGK